MRRIGWGLLGLAALAGIGAVVLRLPAVQDRIMTRTVARLLDNRQLVGQLFKDDALRLLVCGSAAPQASADRARACLAVIAGGRLYVVDVGPGAVNRLGLQRLPLERIGGVFLTHYHSDHIGDLGDLNFESWFRGRPEPLKVHGPAGVERVVAGFAEAYALDITHRIALHGAEHLSRDRARMEPRTLALSTDGTPTPAFTDGELKVSVFPVSHQPVEPAVGYRFDYKGRSIVISGDTRKDANIARIAAGADVLAHEAQNQEMIGAIKAVAETVERRVLARILGDIPGYHTSPVEAAELANAAQVPVLLLYHLMPAPPHRFAEIRFLRGVSAVRKDGVVLARDGTLIELPLDSREWSVRQP